MSEQLHTSLQELEFRDTHNLVPMALDIEEFTYLVGTRLRPGLTALQETIDPSAPVEYAGYMIDEHRDGFEYDLTFTDPELAIQLRKWHDEALNPPHHSPIPHQSIEVNPYTCFDTLQSPDLPWHHGKPNFKIGREPIPRFVIAPIVRAEHVKGEPMNDEWGQLKDLVFDTQHAVIVDSCAVIDDLLSAHPELEEQTFIDYKNIVIHLEKWFGLAPTKTSLIGGIYRPREPEEVN